MSNSYSRSTATLQPMVQAEYRMPPQHPGAGIAHHRPDLLAPKSLIAMHRAFRADGLVRPEPASLQPLRGIVAQLHASGARRPLRSVVIPAVAGDHCRNGLGFSGQPFVGIMRDDGASGLIARRRPSVRHLPETCHCRMLSSHQARRAALIRVKLLGQAVRLIASLRIARTVWFRL